MIAISRTLLMCALAGSLLAQRGPRPSASATPPDPATMAQNQVARLTQLLTLNTTQAAQATTIFTSALTSASTLQTTLKNDRTTLETAITTNATSIIDQVSQNIGVLDGQITAIQAKADAAFYAILNSDQQTKFKDAGLGGRGGLGGPGGFGGRGPGGPRR